MFSTKTTFLAELLQNARRAGATSIHFSWQDGNLTVTDNGCGIADFRTLIRLAETGWNDEIRESERPFGIGFFSVGFAAESVEVESRATRIVFSSSDLIAKNPIAILPSSFIGGTRIVLHGCLQPKEVVGGSLQRYAKGFPVPVHWLGQELPRPDALDNLHTFSTPAGHIRIAGMGSPGTPSFQLRGTAYCQGLPTHVEDFDRRYSWEGESVVVHMDHSRFTPRMPDRDSLIDGKAAAVELQQSIRGLWRSYLEERKRAMSPADFVETFWNLASTAGMLDLMNDVPVLPTKALWRVGYYPVDESSVSDGFWSEPHAPVLKEAVEQGSVTLCDRFDRDGEVDKYPKLLFAMGKEWLFLSTTLPTQHWAAPHLVDLDREPLSIGGNVVATAQFSGRFASGDVKLFDTLTLRMRGESIRCSEPMVVGHDSNGYSPCFLVPKGADDCARVLRQASSYVDSHDQFQETDLEFDQARFADLVAILSGEGADITLWKCLESAGIDKKSNLFGKTFLVEVDPRGSHAVTIA